MRKKGIKPPVQPVRLAVPEAAKRFREQEKKERPGAEDSAPSEDSLSADGRKE